MKKRIRILIIVLFLAFFFFNFNNSNSLKDNYYRTINNDIILENKLDDGENNWSYLLEVQKNADNKRDNVVQDILHGDTKVLSRNEINTITKLYDKAYNIKQRDKDGLGELETYLDKVWNISNTQELVNTIILVENDLGVDLLSNIEILSDYKDNNRNIIYLYPITFAFGINSDYILNPDYMAYKAYIRGACVKLWKVYGYDSKNAREVVKRVFSFYEDVASVSRLNNELNEIDDYYNVITSNEINKIYSGVASKYLFSRNISNEEIYSLVDREQYLYLINTLNDDNLNLWKEVIITKVLSSYASYLSSDYVDIGNNLNESLLGIKNDLSKEKMAINLVSNLFSEEIDKVFEEKYFNNNEVEDIKNIFLDIKKVFKLRLENNSWLGDKAKKMAIIKLDKMDIIIGTDTNVSFYEVAKNLEVSNRPFISDVIRIQKIVNEHDLKRLENDNKVSLVNQTQFNAYYQPLDNSIVIPLSFFELINDEMSYYEKLGTVGMIIAHEVTHAFDGNGAKFDENGNLKHWWCPEDEEQFNELKNRVIDYYSKYEVINGKYIDGDRTVNENIADLGGVLSIVDIASNNKATEEEFKIMFSSMAKMWASVESDDYRKLLLLQDVHSPNEFRVNAVLSSIDEFYRIYDVYPWNDMWIDKNERIFVW